MTQIKGTNDGWICDRDCSGSLQWMLQKRRFYMENYPNIKGNPADRQNKNRLYSSGQWRWGSLLLCKGVPYILLKNTSPNPKSAVHLGFWSSQVYQIFHPFQIFWRHNNPFQSILGFEAFLRISTGPTVWTCLQQSTRKLSGWQSLRISKPLLHVEE